MRPDKFESWLAVDAKGLYCRPGVQSDQLFNALFDAGDGINVVHTRHEQGEHHDTDPCDRPDDDRGRPNHCSPRHVNDRNRPWVSCWS